MHVVEVFTPCFVSSSGIPPELRPIAEACRSSSGAVEPRRPEDCVGFGEMWVAVCVNEQIGPYTVPWNRKHVRNARDSVTSGPAEIRNSSRKSMSGGPVEKYMRPQDPVSDCGHDTSVT